MEEIRQILAGLDWSPLFISIKTGIAATIVSFFLGIWAARKVLKAKTGLRAVPAGGTGTCAVAGICLYPAGRRQGQECQGKAGH